MNMRKNNIVIGLTVGLVAAVLAPVLMPAIRNRARPLAKSLVKGGFLLYEKGREAVASASDMMEDVVAEVRAERSAQRGVNAETAEDKVTQRMYPDFPPQVYGGSGAGRDASAAQFERGGPT